MKIKNVIIITIMIFLFVTLMVLFALFFINENNKNYKETLNSPPKYDYIEQDLETVLISTNVQVLDSKKNNNKIFYSVKVDENKYIVLYEIKSISNNLSKTYRWVYVSHRLII